MSGLGTEVIEDVDVLISVLRVSKAGWYSSVLGSYDGRRSDAFIALKTMPTYPEAFDEHLELILQLKIFL